MSGETRQLTFNPNWCVSSVVNRDSYVTRRQSPTGAACRLSVKTLTSISSRLNRSDLATYRNRGSFAQNVNFEKRRCYYYSQSKTVQVHND